MNEMLNPGEKIFIYRKSGYEYFAGEMKGLPEEVYVKRESYFTTAYTWEEANFTMAKYQMIDDEQHEILNKRSGSIFKSSYRAEVVPAGAEEYKKMCEIVAFLGEHNEV